ncbi:MAG: hypothetical protein J0L84_04350 [Verrucomicrobia bacterium]|nr:hypothetical protein [Verrucomicrobiota bacterium]
MTLVCHDAAMSFRLLLSALLLAGAAWAGPDDDFVEIYQLIQTTDAARESGRFPEAREGYLEAQKRLQELKRGYPTWNERVIAYRLRYVSEKLALLPAPAPATSPAPSQPAVATNGPPVVVEGEVVNQLRSLHSEIGQLRGEKQRLEARLREALTAQPAPVDPRELQAAVQRITQLQATNQFLSERLELQQAERKNLVDQVLVEEAQRALQAANAQLAAQTDKTLELERLRHSATEELQRLRGGDLQRLESENSALKSQVGELAAATDRGEQIANLAERVARLQTGLDAAQQENETLVAARATLEQDLEALRARQTEEGLVRVRQLETDLAFARAEGERQGARAVQLEERLLREQVQRGTLERDNQSLSNRVAELTARVEDFEAAKRQLAAEKEERGELEAQLQAAETQLTAMRAASRPPEGVRDAGAPVAEATASAPPADLVVRLEALESEAARLRDALRQSRARQNELLAAVAESEKSRARWERERQELLRSLQSLQSGPAGKEFAAARKTIGTLESRVQQLEKERDALARKLGELTRRSQTELQVARRFRMGSPREEVVRFRLERPAGKPE